MTQATLMMPRKMNEPRHVTATINQATRGGVKERRALSEPKHDTKKKHCRQTADCTCQQGGGRPDNAADDQPNSRAEPVAHPTTDNLEDEVWIGKSGVHEPDLRVGQMQVSFEDGRNRTHIVPVYVSNPVQKANQK